MTDPSTDEPDAPAYSYDHHCPKCDNNGGNFDIEFSADATSMVDGHVVAVMGAGTEYGRLVVTCRVCGYGWLTYTADDPANAA